MVNMKLFLGMKRQIIKPVHESVVAYLVYFIHAIYSQYSSNLPTLVMLLLTLNKMRHTLLYNSMILLATVRRLGIRYLGSSVSQNSLKPIPSTTLIGLMSLHMNEITFCVQASCRAADNKLVADCAKYVSSRGCFAEVPHIMPYSPWVHILEM